MKTNLHFIIILFFGIIGMQAQNRTTVIANSQDISDNLDLRAIATIFGESATLEDFERRLNDPQIQISNLDLNNDNEVDYLRIVENVENKTHLIIIQSVLGRDLFQDVATIEIERLRNNQLQIQIVGDVFMYGSNYIYEPIYNYTPIIYNTFWVNTYRPYCSPWYWNYYPRFYFAWNPYPYFRYRRNINFYVNYNNTCNFVHYRKSNHAVVMHNHYRTNGFERQYPNRSFSQRNNGYQNRYELTQTRSNNSSRGQLSNVDSRPTTATSYSNSTANIPRTQTPRSSSYNSQSIDNTPKPRVNTYKKETVAYSNPRSNSSLNSETGIYSNPRTNQTKNKEYLSNNTPRNTPRSSQNNIEQTNSIPVQPRINSGSKAQRSNNQSRSNSNSNSRNSNRTIQRG